MSKVANVRVVAGIAFALSAFALFRPAEAQQSIMLIDPEGRRIMPDPD